MVCGQRHLLIVVHIQGVVFFLQVILYVRGHFARELRGRSEETGDREQAKTSPPRNPFHGHTLARHIALDLAFELNQITFGKL